MEEGYSNENTQVAREPTTPPQEEGDNAMQSRDDRCSTGQATNDEQDVAEGTATIETEEENWTGLENVEEGYGVEKLLDDIEALERAATETPRRALLEAPETWRVYTPGRMLPEELVDEL